MPESAHCMSCGCSQSDATGYVDFIDGYCEACHDRIECGMREAQESLPDHDFTMNH